MNKIALSNLSFTYPAYYIFICLLVGLAAAILLYYRDPKFKDQSFTIKFLLGFFRFFLVSSICILLLGPVTKLIEQKKQEPVIAVFQDASSSIIDGSDMTKEDYQTMVLKTVEAFAKNFSVDIYHFGNEVQPGNDYEMDQQLTDISAVFEFAEETYANQNLGALFLFTDGLFNTGQNPIYAQSNILAPVYPIALGDTVPRKDLVVKQILHNEIAYLGDNQKIQIDIAAEFCLNQRVRIQLLEKSGSTEKILSEQNITIDRDQFFRTIEFTLEHKTPGNQQYTVRVQQLEGELNTINNIKQFYVDVIDGKQRITLIANAPHPDIAAFARIIDSRKNYEFSVLYASQENISLNNTDVLIFHDLPSAKYPIQSIIRAANQLDLPRFFVIGAQTDINTLNKYQDVLNIAGSNKSLNEVQADINMDFKLFRLNDEEKLIIPSFPPLYAPFGTYEPGPKTDVILHQRIGRISTDFPLLAYSDLERKTAVLTGEGYWKWRMVDKLQNKGLHPSDELIGKSLQYLSVKEDKRKFRVSSTLKSYTETQQVVLGAELYNNIYELINEPEVTLQLFQENGDRFEYSFSKQSAAYNLNLGFLSPGQYSFQAQTNYRGVQYESSGNFIVEDIQLESYNLQADHGLLRQVADKYNGKLVYPEDIDAFIAEMSDNDQIKPVLYSNTTTKPIIHLKYIFFLLLLSVSAEWFIRRYIGFY